MGRESLSARKQGENGGLDVVLRSEGTIVCKRWFIVSYHSDLQG